MFEYKKPLHIIILLFVAFLLFKIVNNVDALLNGLKFLLSLFIPFLVGFFIAYMLNPIMCYLERLCKLKRIYSILIVYMFTLAIIILVVTIISPSIINSISEIIKDMPKYIKLIERWINLNIIKSNNLQKYGVIPYVESNLNYLLSQGSKFIDLALNNIIVNVINFTSLFFKLFLGFIISIYLLKDKEDFIIGSKKILYSFLSDEKAKKLINFGREVDNIFSQFIMGKIIDSSIIGFICFLGLLILKVPYALLISIIIGMANTIPYFGPIVGMIPCVAITFFYSPEKALWVLIFILILQQFDGLILEPKILGDKVGLNPFWIILAIIVGGELLGVIGMFLGVPVVAIIKMILERYINNRIISKR